MVFVSAFFPSLRQTMDCLSADRYPNETVSNALLFCSISTCTIEIATHCVHVEYSFHKFDGLQIHLCTRMVYIVVMVSALKWDIHHMHGIAYHSRLSSHIKTM